MAQNTLRQSTVVIEKPQSEEIIHINRFYNDFVKRAIDFVCALILFVFLIPVFIFVAIFIKSDSNGPVFYRALRGGYKQKNFKIFKFRTMVINADQIGGPTTGLNDKRITRVGKFLRKTKLDEIPQLLNIIKGEMSFIGPRPEVLQYTNLYEGNQKYILQVRPGITDISSLKFISLDEHVGEENVDENFEKYILAQKNELRVEYVRNQTVLLDFKLFCQTVFGTLKKIFDVLLKRG